VSVSSVNSQFLYAQTGANGILDEFHVNGNGASVRLLHAVCEVSCLTAMLVMVSLR
jgi:hypothetical protein